MAKRKWLKLQIIIFLLMLVFSLSILVYAQAPLQTEPVNDTANGARAKVLAILKKLEAVGSFHCTKFYTSTTTRSKTGESQLGVKRVEKIWQKGPYLKSVRVDLDSGEILINRPEGIYIYSVPTKTFIAPPDFAREAMLQSFKLPPNELTGIEKIWTDVLDNDDLRIIGTEIIDGKEATVIVYTIELYPGTGNSNIKLWLWNKNGLTLRRETTHIFKSSYLDRVEKGDQRTDIEEWRDFVFEDFPDSLFDVPEGRIQKLPEDWHL